MEALVTQYKWALILLACLLLVGTSGFATWKVDSWRYGKQLAEQSAGYQADLAAISNAAAAQSRQALAKQQTAEQAVAALDQESTQEKDTLNAENESLRRAVAAGDHRLHIAGTCPASSGNVPGTARATGLGDATTVELAPAAGQSVFDIRAGIIADQAALKAAQAYIKDVCRCFRHARQEIRRFTHIKGAAGRMRQHPYRPPNRRLSLQVRPRLPALCTKRGEPSICLSIQ